MSKTWSRKRKAQPQQVELDELRDGGEQHWEAGACVAEDGPEAGVLAEPAYLTEIDCGRRIASSRSTYLKSCSSTQRYFDCVARSAQNAADTRASPPPSVTSAAAPWLLLPFVW